MIKYCRLLGAFKMFSSQIRNTHVLCSSSKKVAIFFTILVTLQLLHVYLETISDRIFFPRVSLSEDNSHCVKSVRIWNFSGTYFPAFRVNTERYSVSLCIQSECGKIRTRITPNMDTFHAVFKFKLQVAFYLVN